MVFNEDLSDAKSRKALIFHQLFIDYTNNQEDKRFVISLDINDVKKLKARLERAIEKENILSNDYKDSLQFLRFDSND